MLLEIIKACIMYMHNWSTAQENDFRLDHSIHYTTVHYTTLHYNTTQYNCNLIEPSLQSSRLKVHRSWAIIEANRWTGKFPATVSEHRSRTRCVAGATYFPAEGQKFNEERSDL